MNRTEFEAIRGFPGKIIEGDIRFSKKSGVLPALVAEDIKISNGAGVDLRMNITYNPEIGSKSINVHVPGTGPICRLEVDGKKHEPAGRSHKHSVQTERCPDRNLPDGVIDRPDLSGKPLAEVFSEFCSMAEITHAGQFEEPDSGSRGEQ